jgi:hypothetical protein
MNIATVVLTAPRPKETLQRTLASLLTAGFGGEDGLSTLAVHRDKLAAGHFRAYIDALRCGVDGRPDADAYFIVEDDVVFCRGLREYLAGTLWPGPAERIALCSPYCPAAYRQVTPGWSDAQSHRGLYLAGSQAWVFPPRAARAILAEVAPRQTTHNADWEIGQWADATRRTIWYHTPSLAQHEGLGNSALGDNLMSDIRRADDFIGEGVWPEVGKER